MLICAARYPPLAQKVKTMNYMAYRQIILVMDGVGKADQSHVASHVRSRRPTPEFHRDSGRAWTDPNSRQPAHTVIGGAAREPFVSQTRPPFIPDGRRTGLCSHGTTILVGHRSRDHEPVWSRNKPDDHIESSYIDICPLAGPPFAEIQTNAPGY